MHLAFKRAVFVGALVGVLIANGCSRTTALTDFTSDGCSLFPDGNPSKNPTLWCDCCLAHDVAYWRGGTETDRKNADQALRTCVLKTTGDKKLADLMYRGVRSGGHPVFPAWYRWGYGWTYGRGYEPLTDNELSKVNAKLETYRQTHKTLSCAAR